MKFLCFTTRASRALTKSHFRLNIIQKSEKPHQKKENVVGFVTN